MTGEAKRQKYLTPGTYLIRATIRHTFTVEPGQEFTEMEAVDEVINDPGSELIDWEVNEGRGGRYD